MSLFFQLLANFIKDNGIMHRYRKKAMKNFLTQAISEGWLHRSEMKAELLEELQKEK
jgi:hypothetical protein